MASKNMNIKIIIETKKAVDLLLKLSEKQIDSCRENSFKIDLKKHKERSNKLMNNIFR